MQSTTGKPAVTAVPQGEGTGPGAQATIKPPTSDEFVRATQRWYEAMAAEQDAAEKHWTALIDCHRFDPFLQPAERLQLIDYAERKAAKHRHVAALYRDRAIEIGGRTMPVAGSDTSVAACDEASALIVIRIGRTQIRESVTLSMGGQHHASREWLRIGAASWKVRDLEWSIHEDRIGVELVEFMESLSLPTRVADMLPQRRDPASNAAARAAEEVRHG